MSITEFLFFLNFTTTILFAFAIKSGLLENFLSRIGNIRVKRLARNLEKKRKQI